MLWLSSDTHVVDGAQVTGGGTVEVDGTLEAAGPLSVTAGTTLDLDGALSGAGDRQVDGTLLWSGSIEGVGETVVPAGGSVTVDGTSANLDSVLRTDGSVVFSPSGTLRRVWMFDGTWVHGGSLTLGDAHEIRSSGGTNLFRTTGTGTVTKTDVGTAEIWVPVDNDGTITATDGTLDLRGGSGPETASGTYAGSGAGVLWLSWDTHVVDGAQVTGGGTVEVDGTLEAAGPLSVTAGTTLDLDGTLSGAGDRQVDGTLLWSGSIEGAGETVVPAGGSVTVDGTSANLDSVLRTDGSVVFSPSGTLRRVWMFDGTWVHGGSLTLGDAHEIRSSGGTNLFRTTGTGTVTKTDVGTAEIWVPVDNDGTITATDGTLDLYDVDGYDAGSDTLSGGTYAASGAGVLDLGGVNGVQVLDATIALDGASAVVRDDSGLTPLDDLNTITSNGGVTLRNGQSVTTPGPLTTAGEVTVGATSSLTSTGLYLQTKGTTTLEDASATLAATGSRVEVSAGTLAGVGTAGPDVRITGSGTLSPGLSPGIFAVGGTAELLGGTTTIEIAGATPGTGHDQVAPFAGATVGGTLALSTDAGYDPPLAQTFDVVAPVLPFVTGTFDGVTGLTAGVGKGYDISYPSGKVVATVVAVPGADVVVSAAPVGPAFNVGYPGTWTVSVENVGGAASAGGVSVDLTVGAGQAVTSAAGTGWSCGGTAPVTCTHAGGIPSGGSLPPIDLTVDVTAPAVPSTTLDVVVSGGGDTRPGNNTFTANVAAVALTPPDALFSASTTKITAPGTVSFNAGASTGSIDAYVWDFGDGGTGSGLTPSHTYLSPGLYTVTLRTENAVQHDTATLRITVVEDLPLNAAAGDDRTLTVGTATQLDGGGSVPEGDIDSYEWDFGDGEPDGAGRTVVHSWDAPGTYTVTLAVHRGLETDYDTLTVTVLPPSGLGLGVTVTDGSTGLTGADVTVIDAFGVRYQATTDGSGDATLDGLADGAYTVYAYAPGRLPAAKSATMVNGTGAVTIPLASGAVATQTLESRRLTYAEIIAAGIDPADPANQHVYEFEVCLAFGGGACTTTFTGLANSAGHLLGGPSFTGGSCGASSCTGTASDGREVTASVGFVADQPTAMFLMIPGEARWLKEFFEVKMVVANLAPPGFTFEEGAATLDIPEGLTLAPTADPQTPTVDMADVAGGGDSQSVTWIVRGDEEGLYNLTASYTGTLDPVGASVNLSATTAEPLRVWGGSALEMTVTADDVAEAHHPYRVSLTLTNVTDGSSDPAPVYNPVLELKADAAENWIAQPAERFEQGTDEIPPGGTFTADYVLVPTISGVLNVAGSFVFHVGEGPDLPDTIVSQPRELPVPAFAATPQPGALDLSWDPVVGAVDYVIYRTTSDTTPFASPPVPLATVSAPTTSVTVSAPDAERWYAIGTVGGDGISRMKHELLAATALAPATPVVSIGDARVLEGDTGKARSMKFSVTLSEPSASLVTVDYTTLAGTATAPDDFNDRKGNTKTLKFKPKVSTGLTATTKFVTVKVEPDVDVEGDETFAVALSNPTGLTLGDTTGVGTILDDDPYVGPRVGIGDATIHEGDSDPKGVKIKLLVSLDVPAAGMVTVDYTVLAGTASAPDDFDDRAGKTKTLTIAPTKHQKYVTVKVYPDTLAEGDETFTVVLSNPTGAALTRDTGTVTIHDDD